MCKSRLSSCWSISEEENDDDDDEDEVDNDANIDSKDREVIFDY